MLYFQDTSPGEVAVTEITLKIQVTLKDIFSDIIQ